MTEDQNSGVYDLIQKNGMDSGLGMEYGLALAGIIHQDLTVLNAVEWDWWTACAFGGYTDGLVYLDKDSHQIETSKRLWVLGNFSKFTDEGSVRISITLPEELSDVQSVAFKNPNGTVTAVFINNTDKARSTTLALDGYTRHTTYVTDKDNDLARTDSAPPPMSLPSLPAPSPPWCWKSKSKAKKEPRFISEAPFAYVWKSGRQIAVLMLLWDPFFQTKKPPTARQWVAVVRSTLLFIDLFGILSQIHSAHQEALHLGHIMGAIENIRVNHGLAALIHNDLQRLHIPVGIAGDHGAIALNQDCIAAIHGLGNILGTSVCITVDPRTVFHIHAGDLCKVVDHRNHIFTCAGHSDHIRIGHMLDDGAILLS